MKEQKTIPVIQDADFARMTRCSGCSTTENVKGYEFRTSSTTTQAIAWCNKCARQVATFLLKPERSR